jgi:hypothetical protein
LPMSSSFVRPYGLLLIFILRGYIDWSFPDMSRLDCYCGAKAV